MNEENRPQRPQFRGSPIGPLILITIGVIFLLNNTGVLPGSGWDLIWRLWPVILILIGAENLWQRQGVAGPTFLIGLGVIFLLSNFGRIDWNVWDLALRLWPILIIAIGLDIVLGRRSLVGALVALLLMAALLGGALILIGSGSPPTVEAVAYPLDAKAVSAEVVIKPGVGSLTLGALDGGENLLEGTLYLQRGERYNEDYNTSGSVSRLTLDRGNVNIFIPSFGGQKTGWQLKLNNALPVDLSVDMGVGDLFLDLRQFHLLKALQVNMGIGRTDIYLPAQNLTANFDGGIGQAIIHVPKGVAVRIVADTGIGAFNPPSSYRQVDDGEYLSPNAESASIVLTLKLDQGIGSLDIVEER